MSVATKFMQLSNRTVNYLRLQMADASLQRANYYGLLKDDIAIINNQIFLKKLNLKIANDPRYYFLFKGYKTLLLLKEQSQASVKNDSGIVVISIADLNLEIETEADVAILHEIYIDGFYNFEVPTSCLMFDIGLNVGYVSLFFANNKNVEKIFSFEPLKPTYAQAQKNLNRNPEQSTKINTHNFGLSDAAKTIEIDYSYEWKGSVGIAGFPTHLQGKVKTEKQPMELKSVSEIFNIANAYNSSLNIGIKIDCEGAEYEIMPQLITHPNFNRVKFIMMEWHFKGPEILVQQLTSKGFNCFSFNPMNTGGGMIYATKAN